MASVTDRGEPRYDVVVVGAGNAALCAALSAREQGASVLVLEKASRSEQGGNCPFTGGGFRFVHDGIDDLRGLLSGLTDREVERLSMAPYTAGDFREHLTQVTRGETDPDLMEVLVNESRPTVDWMHAQGVTWELSSGARPSSGAPSVVPNSVGLSASGSGPGLVRMLTDATRRAGVEVLYQTRMAELRQGQDGGVTGVEIEDRDGNHTVSCKGVVLACGGFEASPEMRSEHLGEGWRRAKVRGSRHNTGDGHRVALKAGARPAGQWAGCHATPIDAGAPATGDLRLTDAMPRRSYSLGITVNLEGKRFADEGEGFAEQTFVTMGGLILQQTRGIAFQIFDAKALPHLEPRYGGAQRADADNVVGLARKLYIDPESLDRTLNAFNAAAHRGEYEPRQLDGRSTRGLEPPKSNWALTLDVPPFVAFTVTGGITYTYGGLKISARAEVLDHSDEPVPGLFAAGEIVGGVFLHNSLRAAGLMHGAVFGRLAGIHAARGR